jgi:hypothetical protein
LQHAHRVADEQRHAWENALEYIRGILAILREARRFRGRAGKEEEHAWEQEKKNSTEGEG